ncbi:restriction endonuclease [Bacillaceae bacterium SIJ1]|uniref:restriction endonuclease n=1 Tax=Litoribacterium kuwaitense TaxID=1398745 RepID=UPI0013E9EC78|nr:restriction endonuclease [Litoribacterium kuwaitense]NGP45368.1 restriction endonuclease [Litoribacterium kuwaitense]
MNLWFENLSISWVFVVITVFFTVLCFFFLWRSWRRKKRYDVAKITLRDIDRMEGHEFEDYLTVLLASIGFVTRQTAKSRDFGADIILTNEDGTAFAVQAKRYRDAVGISAVQEVFSSVAFYKADRGVIITSAPNVTEACWHLAKVTHTIILVRDDLQELITRVQKRQALEARQIVEEAIYPDLSNVRPRYRSPGHQHGKVTAGAYYMKV